MFSKVLEIKWKDFGKELPKNFQVNYVVLSFGKTDTGAQQINN
ncbi:hypothetical protein [Aequorivita capsosiphonis]|nr:hypothetical protein [Aequorivita capsosiphonis]